MNRRQAVENGYGFTGAYSHIKEEMKDEAKKERKGGYKAVVVNVPTNPLSRGYGGMGYSVYRKPTEKKIKELLAKKVAKEQKQLDDNMKVIGYLAARTKEELQVLFVEAKGSELMNWAVKNKII